MMKKNELVRQMGNARLLITGSCSTLTGMRISFRLMNLSREQAYIYEKKIKSIMYYRISNWMV